MGLSKVNALLYNKLLRRLLSYIDAYEVLLLKLRLAIKGLERAKRAVIDKVGIIRSTSLAIS